MSTQVAVNSALDLTLERIIDVPVERVWRAWTEAEHLKVWFCPRPWRVSECSIDLRPGGMFKTVMQGPEGETHQGNGCYLEIVPQRKLVWTDALEQDYRPNATGNGCFDGAFTAFVMMEPEGPRTRYRVIAKHGTPEACAQHQAIGFEEGWSAALEQLVEYVRGWKEAA